MRRPLLALTIGCLAAGLDAAPAPKPPDQLVIVSNRTGNAEIYLVNPDGSGAKNLTESKSTNAYPAWSPDGKKIAFASDRSGVMNIYVMDPDGKNVQAITKANQSSRVPSWSPDGKKIAFCRATANGTFIHLMDADGSNVKQIGNGNGDGYDPAWSPDGTKILFTSLRNGNGFSLFVMDADGSNVKQLASKGNRFGYVYPTWSPDGKKVSWTDIVGNSYEVFCADADGKNEKQLTKLGGVNTYATWSSDGKHIVFHHSGGNDKGAYYVMDPDGENRKEIAKDEPLIEGGRPGVASEVSLEVPRLIGIAEALLHKLRDRRAVVGVIGLGYVGLPLARCFAAGGFRVLGFDVDRAKVEKLQRGESYIGHIPSRLVAEMRERGFEATDHFERLAEAEAILICVPTPLTDAREPDLQYVEGSARAIAAHLRPGQLIVLESTTYPGTTRDVVRPILEANGLTAGRDFFLSFSPEREDPGNPDFSAPDIPKVVGGLDATSLELAAALYGAVVSRVVCVSTPEVAEACKILENTYRAVNIALVNELKILYDRMGIDIWEVIEAAKTKPFGFQAFYPGPGLGGHCIPIDPFYLTWVARRHGLTTRFIELAGEVNTAMPAYVVHRIADALNERGKPIKGSKIVILGMAYKKDVDDPRESPGFELMALLLRKGAVVNYNDPHIPRLPRMRHYPELDMASQPLTPAFLASQDAALIATDHSAYDWPWLVEHAPLVIDTRNATRGVTRHRERIVRA